MNAAAAAYNAPVAPNAQNIVGLVMCIVFLVLFMLILTLSSGSNMSLYGLRRETVSELKEDVSYGKKWKRVKMLAWLGVILSIALALAFTFGNFQFGYNALGQNTAMMAEIVIAIIFIILAVPLVIDCKGGRQAVAIVILVIAVIWIIVAAVVYSVQIQQIQTVATAAALIK